MTDLFSSIVDNFNNDSLIDSLPNLITFIKNNKIEHIFIEFINKLLTSSDLNNLFKCICHNFIPISPITELEIGFKLVYEITNNYVEIMNNNEKWYTQNVFKFEYIITKSTNFNNNDLDVYNTNKNLIIDSVRKMNNRVVLDFTKKMNDKNFILKSFNNIITSIDDLKNTINNNRHTQHNIITNQNNDINERMNNIFSFLYNLENNIFIKIPSIFLNDEIIVYANSINKFEESIIFYDWIEKEINNLIILNDNYIKFFQFNEYLNVVFTRKISNINSDLDLSTKISNMYKYSFGILNLCIDFLAKISDNTVYELDIINTIKKSFDRIINYHIEFVNLIENYKILSNYLSDDIIFYVLLDYLY